MDVSPIAVLDDAFRARFFARQELVFLFRDTLAFFAPQIFAVKLLWQLAFMTGKILT